jgi:hypothetical protein
MAVLLTSKVSILASLLIFLTFPLIKASEKISLLRVAKDDFHFSLIITVVFPLLAMAVIYYAFYFSSLFDRISFFYYRMDLVSLLLSGRNNLAYEAIEVFYKEYSIIEALFGVGQEWFRYMSGNKMVEIDFVDFIMTYGLFGIIISYGFFVFLLSRNFVAKKKNKYFGYCFFMTLLLIGISLTSGHILNSGVSGALIGSLMSLSSCRNESQ